MSQSKSSEQQRLNSIKKRQIQEIQECPKSFFQLLSFMDGNLRKQFKNFSIFTLCQGNSYRLRFNDRAFEKAFASLEIRERLDFYEKVFDYGRRVFGKNKVSRQALDLAIDQEIKMLLSSGSKQIKLTIHEGFLSKEQTPVKIQKFKIYWPNNISINLQNYILRQSRKKSSPQCYVLQAINKSQPERIRFSFANKILESQNLKLLKKLEQLAFRSTINAMIAPQQSKKGLSEVERKFCVKNSLERLPDQQNEIWQQELAQPNAKKSVEQSIKGQKILAFSQCLLTAQKTSNQPAITDLKKVNQIEEVYCPSSNPSYQLINSNSSKRPPVEQEFTLSILNEELGTQKDSKIPLKSNKQSLYSPIQKMASSEVQQYTETEHRKLYPQYKNIFELMLHEFNLREFELSVSAKIFSQIYMSTQNGTKFIIYQHKDRPQRFKCQLLLQDLEIDKIYCILLNHELLKQWNDCVNQSKIKIALTGENCLVCYQNQKRYSTWFKQRDYLFLRHAFFYRQCRYIADRSIEHSSFFPFESIQRGQIKHFITRLRQVNNKQIELIVDMNIDHKGYLGIQKKKQLSINFLKQYQKLQSYLTSQKQYSTMPICNLWWSIDWIDQPESRPQLQSLGLKTQEFEEGSVINCQFDPNDIQLQSEDFFSIKDQNQQNANLAQTRKDENSNQNFIFQNTGNFMFAKTSQMTGANNLQTKFPEKQLELEDLQKTIYDELNNFNQQITLDAQGFCILPQHYIKKKHPIEPKLNYHQERTKIYDNIVLKQDFVQDKDGGIKLTNKTKIKAQNNVINFLMKTMKQNLFSGKSILSISLPVEIFRADSNTQRLCQSMTLGPYFLEKAAKCKDSLQRMKWSICCALSNSIMYFYIQKPFNPILGQTYQGIIDGCPIYAQQISHHPPVTSIYFAGRGFRVYASLQAKVNLHFNSGEGINYGFYTIQFDDGNIIKFQTAPGELSGFTIGDRRYRFKDKMYIYDKKNCYFSVLNFEDPESGFFSKGKWKYTDQMEGDISKVAKVFIDKFQSTEQRIQPNKKQIEKVLSKMQGRWIYDFKFDGKVYYDIVNDIPFKLVNYEYTLNSDARYREDLIYRMRNDISKSQIYKQILENKQRNDRKLRDQYHKKTH